MNVTIYSPMRIAILMHIHCRPCPFELPESDARSETLLDFLQLKVIRDDAESGSGYSLTPLGKAWVAAICNTPLPQQVFVDSHGKVITP